MQESSWDTYKEATDRLLPRYELYKKRWTSSDPRSTKTMAHYLLAAKPLISRDCCEQSSGTCDLW
jgi:hypothetical protein